MTSGAVRDSGSLFIRVLLAAIVCAGCEKSRQHLDEQRASTRFSSEAARAANSLGISEAELRKMDPNGGPCTIQSPNAALELSYTHLADETRMGNALIPQDVTVAANGDYSVMDTQLGVVATFDRSGSLQRRFRYDAGGPETLRAAKALAVGMGGRYYVAATNSLKVFSREGRLLKTVPISISPSDIAIGTDGSVVLTTNVWTRDVLRAGQAVPYAIWLDSSLTRTGTLATVSPSQMDERPFLTPALTEIRVVAGPERRFAIWFAYDPWIFVFQDRTLTKALRGCLPQELPAKYKAQRSRGNLQYQAPLRLVRGVWFADDGGLQFLTVYKTGKRAIVTAFKEGGELLGEFEDTVPVLRHFGELVASGGSNELIAWNVPQLQLAHIDRWRIELPHN